MNLQLKAIFFCVTNGNRWGRGYSIAEAKKNAGVKRGTQYYIQAAMFNDPSKTELDNLFACITACNISGSPKFYDDGRTEEDTEMIKRLHVGWCMIEKTKDVVTG